MDRHLRVLKNECLLAELKFRYDWHGSGKVQLTTYKLYERDDGGWSSYPYNTCEIYVHHNQPLKTIEEVNAYDRSLLQKEAWSFPEEPGTNLVLIYEEVHFRYLLSNHREVVGIVDIWTDFSQNKKELKFTSAQKVRNDYQLPSDSLECNMQLMRRLGELEFLQLPPVDYHEAECWYM